MSGIAASVVQGFSLGDEDFCADVSGALFHAGERLLIVADLHLQKGAAFAERRVLLPPYDTAATLARLGCRSPTTSSAATRSLPEVSPRSSSLCP